VVAQQSSGGIRAVPLSYFYRYATKTEKFMLFVGSLGCLVAGCLLPALAILLGEVTNSFNPANGYKSIYDGMKWTCLWITIVGVVSFVAGYIYYALFQHVAENISFNLRSRYLSAFL
jgi:hypothetical protein